jgi:ribonucleoside-diphosphate reductase alpha chain
MNNLSENAMMVLQRRGYLLKKEDGSFESSEEMFRRVAKNIASADKKYGVSNGHLKAVEDKFYEMMSNMEFLSGTVLRNAGREFQQLSACFVLPLEDSLESIFKSLYDTAMIVRSGGGVGIPLSNLRARGTTIKSTAGVSSGPVSYLRLFDHTAEVINESCARRVAMMAVMNVSHPDIEEFIMAKDKVGEIVNFNVSVGITDEFMKAYKTDGEFNLVDPHTKEVVKKVKARSLFEMISYQAWKVGDPGLVFLDKMNKANPNPQLGDYQTTNPCGEQPLLSYESCNLGNINLSKCVKDKKTGGQDNNEQSKKIIDWDKLEMLVKEGVHFLDNVIDMCQYPIPEIDKMARTTRKIGLGVMGFADMLIDLGISYDGEEGIKTGEKVAKFIQEKAREASAELGERRGSFPAFFKSRLRKKYKAMRNACVNTVAPTGTISIFANCSSGIEPLFALSYVRKNILDIGKTTLFEVNPIFMREASEKGFYSEKLMEEGNNKGGVRDISGVPESVKKVFVTSHEIATNWHIKMQSAWQKYTDAAVSKTINLPNSATAEDVKNSYWSAYEMGCKGVTVYRDGSRGDNQVLSVGYAAKDGERNVTEAGEEKVTITATKDFTEDESSVMSGKDGKCPECGGMMEFRDGCVVCPGCAYSYCSI